MVTVVMMVTMVNGCHGNSPLGSDARINIVIDDNKTIKNIPRKEMWVSSWGNCLRTVQEGNLENVFN